VLRSTLEAARSYRRTMREWVAAFRVASDAVRAGMLDVEFPARAQPPRLLRPPVEAAA
jgi:hypothetical protein